MIMIRGGLPPGCAPLKLARAPAWLRRLRLAASKLVASGAQLSPLAEPKSCIELSSNPRAGVDSNLKF
jgi:hypothetical protein